MPSTLRVRKPQPRRLGIVLEDGGPFKHLLSLGVNPDGGLIVTPAAGAERWRLTALGENGEVKDSLDARTSARPKLHYHLSGLATIELPGAGVRRVRAELPPLTEVTGRQVFHLHQAKPESLPELAGFRTEGRQFKQGDGFVVSHNGWPEAVSVTGILFSHRAAPGLARSYIPSETGDGLPPWQIVPGGTRDEQVLDLGGRGLPALLVLRYNLDFEGKAAASTTLAGLCGRRGWPSPIVLACSLDGPPAIGLLALKDMPSFRRPRVPNTSRRRVTRSIDAGPTYGDRL